MAISQFPGIFIRTRVLVEIYFTVVYRLFLILFFHNGVYLESVS